MAHYATEENNKPKLLDWEITGGVKLAMIKKKIDNYIESLAQITFQVRTTQFYIIQFSL